MTNFEIFMVVLGVVDTLTALGSFVVALLSFLRKRKTKQNTKDYFEYLHNKNPPYQNWSYIGKLYHDTGDFAPKIMLKM